MPPEILSLVLGTLVPSVVQQITSRTRAAVWPSWAKLGVALATSAVLGVVAAWSAGDIGSDWWASISAVFVASQVAYRTYWHRQPPADDEA